MGVNNIGKSTQVEKVASELKDRGKRIAVLKYPIYDYFPTGQILNRVMHGGLPMPHLAVQILASANRLHFQPKLFNLLKTNDFVLAEDYKGTGIAWGIVFGIPRTFLELINFGQRREDLSILLDGERFSGAEAVHPHENSQELWGKARLAPS